MFEDQVGALTPPVIPAYVFAEPLGALFDDTTYIKGKAYVMSENEVTADAGIALVSFLEDPRSFVSLDTTIVLAGNTSTDGEMAEIVTEVPYAGTEITLDSIETGVVNARCGIRGQQQGACNATIKVYEADCANAYSDPAEVIANCPLLVQKSEADSTDDRYAYYNITQVPFGEHLYIVAESRDLTDELGLPILSSHPNVQEGGNANLVMAVKVDGSKQGMKTGKQTGSELWVYEPTSILWDGVTEYYPFVFESDSHFISSPEIYISN